MIRDNIGFVMYKDYFEYFSYLTKEEKADLLDAIFTYAFQDECPTSLSPVASLAFAFVRNQIDRDFEKYDKRCEKNRKNGALGGRPRKDESEEKEMEKAPEVVKEESCDMPEKTREQFEEFFDYYPKKSDREEARAEFARLSPDAGEFSLLMDHLRYCQKSESWKKEGGRYIPKASVWLSRREWKSQPTSKGSFDTDDFFEAALRR